MEINYKINNKRSILVPEWKNTVLLSIELMIYNLIMLSNFSFQCILKIYFLYATSIFPNFQVSINLIFETTYLLIWAIFV